MATITDSQNVVRSLETAPDRLRAEIGSYFSETPLEPPSLSNISPRPVDFSFRNYAVGVKNHYITTIAYNDQV